MENNISYGSALVYRRRHPDIEDDQVIEYFMKRGESFKQKCIDYNVNYQTAIKYRKIHPELSDEQVIIQYRPDLRINIFGEIIEEK